MKTPVTIAGKTQWDAPITYASREAYELAKRGDDLKIRIGGIESQIRKLNKDLTRRSMAEYIDEISEEIAELENGLPKVKAEFDRVFDAFQAEGGCW